MAFSDSAIRRDSKRTFRGYQGAITLPGPVKADPVRGEVSLSEIRELSRATRGCQLAGGPQGCEVYQMQACSGGSAGCTIEDNMSRG